MRLIITRHGETEENKKGIIQGHLPGKLSEEGIEQAKKLSLRLKDEKIDFIYSSDLARVKDTTKEIIKFHPKIPIEYVKELRERNWGEFQGKTRKEIGYIKEKWSTIPTEPKNAESLEELFNRAKGFVYKILEKHPNDNILFVCHNGIKKAIVCAITGKKAEDIKSMNNFMSTSITIFEIDKEKNHKIHTFNCSKHLQEGSQIKISE